MYLGYIIFGDQEIEIGGKEMEALQLEKYDEWLSEHMEELVAQNPGKVVAI